MDDSKALALANVHAIGVAAWPGIDVPFEEFVRYFARQAEAAEAPRQGLQLPRGTAARDVYLACACGRGDLKAIVAFDATYQRSMRCAFARLGLGEDEIADALQDLRRVLFTRSGSREPRILTYRGQGSLASWLRVAVTRAALKVRRKVQNDGEVDECALLEARAAGDDPELALLKVSCRSQLTASFQEALDALDDRTRTVLRLHTIDGLTIDELGGLFRVHRATAARWVAAAHETLLDGTRQNLMRKANIGPAEWESILRLVRSQLAETLRRRLEAPNPHAERVAVFRRSRRANAAENPQRT